MSVTLRTRALLLSLFCTSSPILARESAIPGTGFKALDHYRASRIAIYTDDFGELARYRALNAQLSPPAPDEKRVVFFGDSITDQWNLAVDFPGRPYVNRGIGGQTTAQMLVRFRQDVIDLHPAAVVILAGTNDIAGNTGPTRNDDIEANLTTMAELARAHGIQVILASLLPVHKKGGELCLQRPSARIHELNVWLGDYCRSAGLVLLDYYRATVDEQGMLRSELSGDGLHPNEAGYRVMAPLAEKAIAKALAIPAR
jgi:lysophospholipase L1-like esterase